MGTKVTRTQALEMRAAYEGGEDQISIAKRYNELGVLTNWGRPLDNRAVSHIIRHMAKGRKPAAFRTPIKKSEIVPETFMLDTIANKELSNNQKIKVLTALME